MAATTIGRESMTDGTTVWNVTRIGSAIYDRVDSLIANNITFGGLLNAEGFGTHAISTSGTGGNIVRIRNTSAGTGNYSRLELGNDSASGLGALTVGASTSTFGDPSPANGMGVASSGAGGLVLAATHASGTVRLANGSGATARLTVETSGLCTFNKAAIYTPGTPVLITSTTMTHVNNGVMFPTTTGAYDVQGLTAGSDGQVVYLVNTSSNTMTLKHENATATAADRFRLSGDADLALAEDEGVVLVYSSTKSRWIACLG